MMENKNIPKFKDSGAFYSALKHKALSPKKYCFQSERLEFLGDSIISSIITELLFIKYPQDSEGALSEKRASLVNKETLGSLAQELGFNKLIFNRKNKEISNKVYCQIFESVIGAYYLDSGFEKVKEYLIQIFESKLNSVSNDNFKGLLQVLCMELYKQYPKYVVLLEHGQDHNKQYEVGLFINNKFILSKSGSSIKNAEKDAAKEVYLQLKKEN